MIPKNIKKSHILKAIRKVDKSGVPPNRTLRKFSLRYRGKDYPPKYIISLASRHTNGVELSPSEFSGGQESNNFLKSLGFRIKQGTSKPLTLKPSKKRKKRAISPARHNDSCPRCKETIEKLLEKIFGGVEINHKFSIPANPEEFKGKHYYKYLKRIYSKIQAYRGYKKFTRAKTLPNCDFFIPEPGLLVEFDESQHFTAPRRIALANYPKNIKLGFDKQKWMDLCINIQARDKDPVFRDEQRAWYDTLRDFLPYIKGLKPTVRLYPRDLKWCDLDPQNPEDIKRFKKIISRKRGLGKIEIIRGRSPSLARIILVGGWAGDPEEVKKLIDRILKRWPRGEKVKFLVTCGGFIQFSWPKNITREQIGDIKDPDKRTQKRLFKEAEKCVKGIFTKDLMTKLRKCTDYITIGIDSRKDRISKSNVYIKDLHVELVLLLDVKRNRFHWTGKSYPTCGQAGKLVRITDHKSHFINLDSQRIFLLGCHDLNIFNERNKSNTGPWRTKIKTELRKLAKKKRSTVVLHHPHTSVKVKTWSNPWNFLHNLLPSVKLSAGAGRYCEPQRSKYDDLENVLDSTKRGESIDFVVL